jgi:hypothetical protein
MEIVLPPSTRKSAPSAQPATGLQPKDTKSRAKSAPIPATLPVTKARFPANRRSFTFSRNRKKPSLSAA